MYESHRCRNQNTCPEGMSFIEYTGATVKQCLCATVEVFQDGYIQCPIIKSIGCEECMERFGDGSDFEHEESQNYERLPKWHREEESVVSEELQEVKYYELMNYKDSKAVIKSNINQLTNNFVAIGFYLKHIRDNEMYKEDGYQNIWDMAHNEFGFSQSWASRCMSVNDRFSKDGNSPILLDQYRDFDKSKLTEMLTLTDKQLEQVTIATTVAEIKDIKRTEKSYATSHKESEPEKVAPEQLEPDQPQLEHKIDQRIKNGIIRAYIDGFTDWKKDKIRREFASSKNLDDRVNYLKTCVAFGGTYLFLEGEEKKLYLRKAGDEELELSDWYNNFSEFVPGVTRFVFTYAEMAGIADGMLFEIKQEHESVNNQPDIEERFLKCSHNPEAPCNIENVVNVAATLDDVNCNGVCCWNCKESCEAMCNPAVEHQSQIHLVNNQPEIMDNKPESDNDVDDQAKQDYLELDCYNTEEGWHKEYIQQKQDELDLVDIVEADIIQTPPDNSFFKRIPIGLTDANGKQICEGDILLHGGDTYHVHWYQIEARFVAEAVQKKYRHADLEEWPMYRINECAVLYSIYGDEPEPVNQVTEESKPVQPDLPILKNNDQRKEWAENYKAWGEWYYDEHIDCHYYKYDFSNSDRLVVEEYLNRNGYWGHDSNRYHYHLLQKHKPAYEKNKTFEQKYIHTESSMTEIVEFLKDFQKKGA